MLTAVHQMLNVWPVPITTGLESSGPFADSLVILSLLGSAVSTVDYKRKRAEVVAIHEVWWWVTKLALICTKLLFSIAGTTCSYSPRIYSSAKAIKLHPSMYI